jgi:hypothetical protein
MAVGLEDEVDPPQAMYLLFGERCKGSVPLMLGAMQPQPQELLNSVSPGAQVNRMRAQTDGSDET